MVTKSLDVPIRYQKRANACGPACLEMVFAYWGKEIGQREIMTFFGGQDQVIDVGVRNHDMVLCARDRGFSAYARNHIGIEGLVKYIDRGIPVIARVKSNERGWGHYQVIVGYERHDRGWEARLYYHDPVNGMLYGQYDSFKKKWWIDRKHDKTKNYGFIIQPKTTS